MNVFFKKLFADKIIFLVFLGTLFLIFISIILILFSYAHLPPFIPLFNQMPWGQVRLGTKEQIFIPTLLSLFIFITNLIFSGVLYEKIPLASRILSITSFLISFLGLLFTVRTIQIIL